MLRWLLLAHRYLGIGLGWLLLAWCVSGVVMMYVAYPSLTLAEQLAASPELNLEHCCRTAESGLEADTVIADFYVAMFDGEPVLRVSTPRGGASIGLARGDPLDEISEQRAKRIAEGYLRAAGLEGNLRYLGPIVRDQWTLDAGFDLHRPLHHFALNDRAATELYVSSASGELLQWTTGRERFWNWVGAVTHWIYPTALRQHASVWLQVIIWTSSVGLFLTVFGIYVGISRLKARKNGRWSPYRGMTLWHHYLGLVFGVLTLTWLLSGLLSVNPWGAFEGTGFRSEALRVRGPDMTWAEVSASIGRLPAATLPAGTVRLAAAPLAGALYYLAYDKSGEAIRLRAGNLKPQPLDEAALALAARRLQPKLGIADARLMAEGDAFYFDHHQKRDFPVYRVILEDDEATRYYLDGVSGRLLQKVDAAGRWHRWLFAGLHRFDFTAGLRRRPLWDVVMIVLMIGVTGVCFTGTYMGVRFLLPRARPRPEKTGERRLPI